MKAGNMETESAGGRGSAGELRLVRRPEPREEVTLGEK